jgi:hypothetical protein
MGATEDCANSSRGGSVDLQISRQSDSRNTIDMLAYVGPQVALRRKAPVR